MGRKKLIYLAVAVVAVFILAQMARKSPGGAARSDGVLAWLGLTTPTAVPRSPQPQNGAQPLQQSPAPSNLATLFPPDVFGPLYDLG